MTDFKILAHSLSAKERTKDVLLKDHVSFTSLVLPSRLLKGLSDCGFERPSPIQVKALPIGRCGFDLIIKSKSGTGKTLVFGLISLEMLRLNRCSPQVLILAPTREIAVQIQEVIKTIGKYYEGLSVESFIGGLPLTEDKTKCKSCHIAVGTPGRVKQLIQDGSLPVDLVKIFVLDEADKLMEKSFQNDINEIYNSLPDNKQIIMCSATYPDELQTFLSQYMRSPVLVTVELETPLLLGLRQYVSLLKSSPNVVQQTKVKNDELLQIVSTVPFVQCLVFSNYQNRAESISNFLNRSGWSSIFISAAQSQTERLSSLSDLKDFKCKILVTTDLTARGIDAPNVDLVINYDIPNDATTYLHRMGRAGRYGSTGNCINLAFTGQESKLLQNILGFIGGQNLSVPILDDTFNLDLEKIPKESYLFGEVDDNETDFSAYSSRISEIRSSLAENCKNKSDEKKKSNPTTRSIENGNVSAVLAQLAAGEFDLGVSTVKENDVDQRDLFNELLGTCKTSAVEKPKSVDKTSNSLLQQLADKGEILDVEAQKVDGEKQVSRNQTFCKNKALFSVAKMLSNVEVSTEDCKDLSAYFSNLKAQESDKKIAPEFSETLENIFSLAYKSQISNNAEKWQNLLPDSEKCKLEDNFNAEEDDKDTSDEECYDEDYDFEIEKDIDVNYAFTNEDDYSFMEWVPVEPKEAQKETNQIQDIAVKSSTLAKKDKSEDKSCYLSAGVSDETAPYHENYGRYFQHCSSNLWQNGLTFESVRDFDQWFINDWEKQLNMVREFVQQKVYLEEMSNN